MPVSSFSMLFTWVIESIILGLIAFAVCEPNYLIYSQLAIAGLSGVLHVGALAADVDMHYAISVSYLCVVTSMLIQDSMVPLAGVGSIITRSFFIIFEIAAMAMTFTSCAGSTPLFFHKRGHYALLLGVGLDFFRCQSGFLGGGIALGVVASQFIPTDTVALIASAVAAGLFAFSSFSAAESQLWQFGLGVFLFLVPAVWLFKPSVAAAPAETLPQVAPTEQFPLPLMVWPRVRPALFKQS